MGHVVLLNIDGNRRSSAARSRVLERAGFRVGEASDRVAALEFVRQFGPEPVLILLRGERPSFDLGEFCQVTRERTIAPVFVIRLLGRADKADAAYADACLRDNYSQPEWLSAIEAFASLLERQTADRRCIEALQAELAAQQQAMERLRHEQNERLHFAVEAAEVGTWWIDFEAGLESRDANVNRILGLPPESSAAPVVPSTARIPLDDRARIEAAFRRLTTEGGVYDEEFRVLLPDGAIRWVRDRGRILTDAGGRPIYATGALADITERKRAELELRHQKEILQTIFDNIPVMIDFIDSDGRLLFVNHCWTQTLGWSLEDIQARDLFAELYPDPVVRKAVIDFIRNPRPGFFDFDVMTRDGRLLHTSWANVLLSDGTSIGIGIDITERKRVEEDLRFNRTLLDALQTAAPVGMAFVDRDFQYIHINHAYAEMTGVPASQHVGRSVRDIVPNLWPMLESCYRRAVALGEVVANIEVAGETLAQPGIRRHWLANYYPLKVGGEIVAAGAVIQDITERKCAEQALQESERRLELALMGAELGSWEWDIGTGAMTVDDRWAKLFGRTPNDISWRYEVWVSGLCPDDRERTLESLEAHLQGRLPFYEAEYRYLIPATGQWAWVSARGRVLEHDALGKPLRAAGVYRDISERKALEERLREQQEKLLHAQRLTTAGELAAMVAHEINQPLGAIANYLGGASLRFGDVLAHNPALAEVINETLRLSTRASEVVKGIRGLVRRQDQQWERLSFPALIDDCLLLVQAELRRRHVKLRMDLSPSLPMVWGRRVHLQQLVLNLIVNAMEAMESCDSDSRELRLQAKPMGHDGIELGFSDTGVGFPNDMAANLTEPFVSTKPGGIGLGLSICRTIVEAHGGCISADSKPGRGATFRVWLPVVLDMEKVAGG
ncbi:PAS domain-containing sensor histidine kinase [Methylomagnum sp.]